MKSLIAACRAAEARPGILAATVFGGFALADTPDSGTSVVVVSDGDRALAEAARDEILAQAWAQRAHFVYRHAPLAETVARAKAVREGPVILLDHADNCGSGATQDVMTVIREVHDQGLEDVAVAAVWDPEAVQIMNRAGIGATVTLALGGKCDIPSIGHRGRPLQITGRVKVLTTGEWTVRGPMYTGVKVAMGPTALLDTGKMEIVVVSRHHEPWDLGVFTSVGIEPAHKRYLLLKSRIHYRAGFGDLPKATFTLDGEGVTTSDNSVPDLSPGPPADLSARPDQRAITDDRSPSGALLGRRPTGDLGERHDHGASRRLDSRPRRAGRIGLLGALDNDQAGEGRNQRPPRRSQAAAERNRVRERVGGT